MYKVGLSIPITTTNFYITSNRETKININYNKFQIYKEKVKNNNSKEMNRNSAEEIRN